MPTTQSLNAQFTADDAILVSSSGFRTDLYNLTTSGPANVTFSAPAGGFLVFDPNGPVSVTPTSRSSSAIVGTFTTNPGVDYQVQVLSSGSLPENYSVQADVPSGDVTLTPEPTAFSTPQTGAAVTPTGQLDSSDLAFIAPAASAPISASNFTPIDEYELDVSLVGQIVDVAVTSTESGFDPFVEVLDAATGAVITADDNSGGGNNPLARFNSSAATDYRIRVSDADGLALNSAANYQLQVSVPSGDVSVAPRENVPVVNADDPSLVPGSSVTRPVPSQYQRVDKTAPGSNFDVFLLSSGNDNFLLSNAPPPTEMPNGNLAKERFVIALDGDDTLTGTDNRDFPATGNVGADTFDLMGGPDVALGGRDSDRLDGGDGNDQLAGNKGIDRVEGGNGDDILLGGQQEDLLLGGNGDDVLVGDLDKDILIGGGDRDTFVLRADADAAADTIADADVIVDFDASQDSLALQGAVFGEVSLEPVAVVRAQTVSDGTAVRLDATGEYLGIVSGIEPSAIGASNFVASPL